MEFSDVTAPPAASSATVLVTKNSYNAAGFLQDTTNPNGIVTDRTLDALGRTIIEYDNSKPGMPTAADTNKETLYTYDGLNHVVRLQVNNFNSATTPNVTPQVTQYTYGGTGSISNDWLTKVALPGGGNETYTYDNLGDQATMTAQTGVVHTYGYDAAGCQISDVATNIPTTMDSTVQELATAYNVLGQPTFLTSEGTPGGAPINQVENAYNGFGQLVTQYQAPNGPVIQSASAKIQYAYDSSNNDSRLSSETYPGGRVIGYSYGGVGTVDDSISRIAIVTDGAPDSGTQLETYSYLGLATVIGRTRPGPNTALNVGLDAFGRPTTWSWTTGGTLNDGYTYSYNPDSTIATKTDQTWGVTATYGYDALGRETSDSRGLFSFTNNGVVPIGNSTNTLTVSPQTWTLDSVGDKFGSQWGSNYAPGGQPGDASYGTDGNAKLLTYSTNNQSTMKFDAWNRLVGIDSGSGNSESTGVYTFTYDALGRRISSTQTNQGTTTTSLSYYDGSNLIQDSSAGTYVWSPDGHLIEQNSGTYVQYDAQGSTTSLTNASGNVTERFTYDSQGRPVSLTANHTAWTNNFPLDPAASPSSFQFLFEGQQWQPLFYDSMVGGSWSGGGGLLMDASGDWTNTLNGLSLAPIGPAELAGQNEYDPFQGETGFQRWFDENSGTIAGGIEGLSWLGGPVVGIPVNWAGASYSRGLNGNGNVFFGGFGDATGISGVYNGAANGSWSQTGLGALQVALTAASFGAPLGALQGPLSNIADGPSVGSIAFGAAGEMGIISAAGWIQSENATNVQFISNWMNGGGGSGLAMALADGGSTASATEAAMAAEGGASAWGALNAGWGVGGAFGNTVFSVLTGQTPSGIDRVSAGWRAQYGPASMRDHHLVPQQLLNDSRFTSQLESLGLDPQTFIDQRIAQIPNALHQSLHAGGWNAQWQLFLDANPTFTITDVEEQISILNELYGVPRSARNFVTMYGR